MNKNKLYRKVIEELISHGKCALNWDERNKDYPINVNSYKDAEVIAHTCKIVGYYAYREMRYGEPCVVHIEQSPIEKKSYQPI